VINDKHPPFARGDRVYVRLGQAEHGRARSEAAPAPAAPRVGEVKEQAEAHAGLAYPAGQQQRPVHRTAGIAQ
jgi:hypothetical protein